MGAWKRAAVGGSEKAVCEMRVPVLFDVEAIFLYPWAYIYRDMFKISHAFGVYGYVEMLIYIAILLVGYIYLWKKGAFDWHK